MRNCKKVGVKAAGNSKKLGKVGRSCKNALFMRCLCLGSI